MKKQHVVWVALALSVALNLFFVWTIIGDWKEIYMLSASLDKDHMSKEAYAKTH